MKNIILPKYMVVSDLDGTIFNIRGEAPSNIKKMTSISDNAYFCIATARPPQEVSRLDIFRSDNLTYSICLDGGLIVSIKNSKFKVIHETLIPVKESKIIVNNILINNEINEFFIFTGEKNKFNIYHVSNNSFDDLFEIKKFQSNRSIVSVDSKSIINLLPSLSIRSISLFTMKDSVITSIKNSKLPDHVKKISYAETRKQTNHKWVDIIPKRTNKAYATQKLCEYLGFSGKVLALGNGANDIELLKFSHSSYAPSDAIPEIHEIASYITKAECGLGFINEIVPLIKNELRINHG